MSEDFTPVVRKNKKRSGRGKYKYVEKTLDDYLEILEDKKLRLKESKFYACVREYLDQYEFCTIRCLALGQPTDTSSTMPAMYQLALLQLIIEQYDIPKVSLWDPIFTDMDRQVFEKLGHTVSETFDTSWELNSCLFYMPHAPLSLINGTLKTLESNSSSLILGNLLTSYDAKMTTENLEKYPYLYAAIKDAENWNAQTPSEFLYKNEQYFQAFNDMSLQHKPLTSEQHKPNE